MRQARSWRCWWCTLLYADASASTLLSLSVGVERDACTSIYIRVCRRRRVRGAVAECRVAFIPFDLSLYSLPFPQSLPVLARRSNKRRLWCTVPCLAGAAPFRSLPSRLTHPIGRAERTGRAWYTTPRPTDFRRCRSHPFRWETHRSSWLQPLVDSSTTNTPIVSRRLTARTTSASICLAARRYCRPTTPASSCDRHVRIAAYDTARRPSGVQQPAADNSSSIAAARQVCLRPRSLFSLTHRPPACKRIVAQSPTCVQCGEPAVGRLAGWREQAVPQNSTHHSSTPIHSLSMLPSLSACVPPSETARR